MTGAATSKAVGTSIFRIDKFVVPPAAMLAFMARVQRTRNILSTLPGCRQNLVLTQTGGPGEFNVITIVEWANAEAFADARSAMEERYAREGFDPGSFMRSLGVRGDLGLYTEVSG